MPPPNVRTIAAYFINKAIDEGKPLTPLQVQKLVYVAYGWYLAFFRTPLFDTHTEATQIQAWRYGPVIPDVYQLLKRYGSSAIKEPVLQADLSLIQDDLKTFLNAIYEKYGSLTGFQLSELTHRQNTPWSEAYQAGENNAIHDELIQKHYEGLLENGD